MIKKNNFIIKTIIILFIIVGVTSCTHFYTKNEVIKREKRNQKKKNIHSFIEDEGRILKVLVRDSNLQKLDEIYEFYEDGTQLRYSLIAYCDSCFQINLLHLLKGNGYNWKKINDSTYVSKNKFNRLLNIHNFKFSYDIIKQSN